ncbi:hypothetical protein BT93_H2242 [Corymbia citriodora subsp. variegata]|nr:hypothetical protein BT93_H2242 [Corymbia citriodora subsp. variegata]
MRRQQRTEGDVARETFSIGTSSRSETTVKRLPFGCGHKNDGIFHNAGSGILGLGGGNPLSLISMTDVGGKFGYCLALSHSLDKARAHSGRCGPRPGCHLNDKPVLRCEPRSSSASEQKMSSYGDNSAGSEAKDFIDVGKMVIERLGECRSGGHPLAESPRPRRFNLRKRTVSFMPITDCTAQSIDMI